MLQEMCGLDENRAQPVKFLIPYRLLMIPGADGIVEQLRPLRSHERQLALTER
jgi:hypothetical protein